MSPGRTFTGTGAHYTITSAIKFLCRRNRGFVAPLSDSMLTDMSRDRCSFAPPLGASCNRGNSDPGRTVSAVPEYGSRTSRRDANFWRLRHGVWLRLIEIRCGHCGDSRLRRRNETATARARCAAMTGTTASRSGKGARHDRRTQRNCGESHHWITHSRLLSRFECIAFLSRR